MSTTRLMVILGVLAVVAFGATGTIVYAAKKRVAENREAMAAAEAYRDNVKSSAQVGLASKELKDPFNQFTDPISGVQSSLNMSLSSEARLSSTSIPDSRSAGQSEFERIRELSQEK